MNLSDFSIGTPFWMAGRKWRCTDIGIRVVVAIRLDCVSIGPKGAVLGEKAASEQGWFNGPPYAVAEHVFDEDTLASCSPEPEHG